MNFRNALVLAALTLASLSPFAALAQAAAAPDLTLGEIQKVDKDTGDSRSSMAKSRIWACRE
jgi:Spy/CpxP family protein refolding chaperone